MTLFTPRFRGRKVRLSPGANGCVARHGSPFGGSTFDDFGAHVGEDLTGEGTGDEVSELDDLDALEWTFLAHAVFVGSVLRWVLRHDDANITPKVVDGWTNCGLQLPCRTARLAPSRAPSPP